MIKLLKDQVESLRYANHLWPLLILRIYAAFFFWGQALEKKQNAFLSQPLLSALIDENLVDYESPAWVVSLYNDFFQAHWGLGSMLIYYSELFLGLLFLVGFLNRPAALYAMFFLYLTSFIAPPELSGLYAPMMMILLSLLVFGSGRVGGVDYFFYKRQRGLIW